MKRIALTSLSCLLVLGLVACDKKSEEADKTAANDEKAPETKDEAKAETKKAQDKPAAAEDAPKAEKAEDEGTKGIGGVVHAVADEPAAAAGAEAAAAAGAEAAAAGAEAAAAGAEAAAAGAEAAEVAAANAAEVAAKAEPKPEDMPHYDTSKDEGGLIGHLASGLAHDDALAAAAETAAELAKLAGEEDLGPSDGEICTHVLDNILLKEFPAVDEELKQEFMKECAEEVEKERIKLGPEIFRQQAECIMAAEDLEDVELCDAAEEEAEQALEDKPHGGGVTQEQCDAAVDHIFGLVQQEFADDPDLLSILNEDIEAGKAEAAEACMLEASPEELACAMKAEKLEDLESCE